MGWVIIFAVAIGTVPAIGGTIYFSTYKEDLAGPPVIPGHHQAVGTHIPAFTWNYSGNYSDPRLETYNYRLFNSLVSVCTNGACAAGGDYGFGQTHPGYEFIYFGFALPSGALNVVLHLDRVTVDDRAIVDLNGHRLGGWGGTYNVTPGSTQQMLDGTGYHAEAFTGPNLAQNLVFADSSWFNAGGVNYLRFWINNTGTGIIGSAYPNSYEDPSALNTYGRITFDQPLSDEVPETRDLFLTGIGLLALTLLRRRRD